LTEVRAPYSGFSLLTGVKASAPTYGNESIEIGEWVVLYYVYRDMLWQKMDLPQSLVYLMIVYSLSY